MGTKGVFQFLPQTQREVFTGVHSKGGGGDEEGYLIGLTVSGDSDH